MNKIPTFAGAALALTCLMASAPAQAQVVFESVYAQPAEMIDGVSVGARIGLGPRLDSAPVSTAPRRTADVASGRRHLAH